LGHVARNPLSLAAVICFATPRLVSRVAHIHATIDHWRCLG
jgi:hypothetical protein